MKHANFSSTAQNFESMTISVWHSPSLSVYTCPECCFHCCNATISMDLVMYPFTLSCFITINTSFRGLSSSLGTISCFEINPKSLFFQPKDLEQLPVIICRQLIEGLLYAKCFTSGWSIHLCFSSIFSWPLRPELHLFTCDSHLYSQTDSSPQSIITAFFKETISHDTFSQSWHLTWASIWVLLSTCFFLALCELLCQLNLFYGPIQTLFIYLYMSFTSYPIWLFTLR